MHFTNCDFFRLVNTCGPRELMSQVQAKQVSACQMDSQWIVIKDAKYPMCPEGQEIPYSDPPPPDIVENITFPFNITSYPAWDVGLKIGLYSVAMAMAIPGNLAVLCTIACTRKLHVSTTLYITQLAISDMMVGMFNMPIHLGININTGWPFSRLVCKFMPFLQILSVTASALFLTAIACDRFFAIVFPLRARQSTRYWLHGAAVLVVWAVAVMVALPNLKVREMVELSWLNYQQCWCEERWPRRLTGEFDEELNACELEYTGRRVYYSLQVVIVYWVPVVFMVTAYSIITLKLRNKKLLSTQNMNTALLTQHRNKKKVVRMLMLVLLVFVLSWTPQQTFLLIHAHNPDGARKISAWVGFLAVYLAYFNSSLNPILYAWLSENFRKGFHDMLRCRLCRKNKVTAVANGEAVGRPPLTSRDPPWTTNTRINMTSVPPPRQPPGHRTQPQLSNIPEATQETLEHQESQL